MTWLLVLIVAPFAVFAVHRGKLISLKRERGWKSEETGRVLADVRVAVQPPRKISGIWFLIPAAASFVPAAAELLSDGVWSMAVTYLTFASMTALFWWIYGWIFRLRAEVVNENMTLTMALTRARRYQWGKFWIAATWLTGLLNIAIWLLEDNVTAFLAAVLGYTLALIAVAMQTEMAARAAQQKLTAGGVGGSYTDEDDYWLLGLFYYNPNDSHFLVNDRIGTNMSVNLAKPAAKILMGIGALLIAALPFIGIWIWTEEATPTRLAVIDMGYDSAIIARHTRDVYTIHTAGIVSAELIDELPPAHRTAGTALENVYKGRWSVRGYGEARLCLQPKNPPFLVVELEGGRIYFINDADSAVTREIYSRFARR
jgi:hypothetical protein